MHTRATRGDSTRFNRSAVKRRRHIRARAPRHPRPPSGIDEIIGDGGKRIGLIAPNIGTAITVTVFAKPNVHAWQELRISCGSSPTAFKPFSRETPIHHFERGNKFAAKQ